MKQLYALDRSRNSELLFRYCLLAIAAEDESIVPVVVRFITSQGRMKYVRPLYRRLYRSKIGRDIAIDTFLEHKDIYHPIAAKMIAIDLKVANRKVSSSVSSSRKPLLLASAWVAAAGIIAAALLRRNRYK